MTITITADGSDLVCRSKYMPAALDDLKARVPYSDRTWDKENKVWRVAARHGQTLVDWARRWYGEDVTLPKVATQAVEETRILDLRYLGKAYERETGGERSATGWVDGGWNAIFPESVLHKWFMDSDDDGAAPVQGPKPTKAKNLYAVLMLQTGATRDELKKNYRRLAKQWHPDTSREPNAAEQFMAIQHAYEILGDDRKRKMYDAGLVLQARAEQQALAAAKAQSFYRQIARDLDANREGYRSPLRCGWVMCKGMPGVGGKFTVTEILEWSDITNAQGQVLVSSWANGADHFEEVWA